MEENIEKTKKSVMVREDLHDMVKSINFRTIPFKTGERHVVDVTLYNGKVIEFRDDKDLFGICMSFKDVGETNFIKSKRLAEELIVNDDGEINGTYICVRYELINDIKAVLFPSDSHSTRIKIDNYYKHFKSLKQKEAPKK